MPKPKASAFLLNIPSLSLKINEMFTFCFFFANSSLQNKVKII